MIKYEGIAFFFADFFDFRKLIILNILFGLGGLKQKRIECDYLSRFYIAIDEFEEIYRLNIFLF